MKSARLHHGYSLILVNQTDYKGSAEDPAFVSRAVRFGRGKSDCRNQNR
jgi:hypothetical protein